MSEQNPEDVVYETVTEVRVHRGALESADRQEVLRVVWRGAGRWAVLDGPFVLTKGGEFVDEPSPSNRSDKFKDRTRFSFEEAKQRARAALDKMFAEKAQRVQRQLDRQRGQ